MAVDTFNYSISTQALDNSLSALQNAKPWQRGVSYEIGDVVIMNNSFYSANYSNVSDSFDFNAWTKINDSADKIKGLNVITNTKANNRVLTYDETTNAITFKDIPSQIDDTATESATKTYSINKIKQLNDLKVDKNLIGVANGIPPLDVNGKIPSQFLSVTGNGSVTYVKNTIAERDALTGLNTGDACIVLVSEDGSREGFVWDGTQWLKDSDSDWVNINIDYNNIINKPFIPTKTSDLTKDDVYTTNEINNIVGSEALLTKSQTLKGAINEVFQSGSNVKANVVTAVTSKGQPVTTQNTWSEIVAAISNIKVGTSTGSANVKEVTKLNVIASESTPYTHIVALDNPIVNNDIVYGVREFVGGSELTNLISTFDNADSDDFKPNQSILFDGSIKLADKIVMEDMVDEGVLDTGNLYTFTVNKTSYNIIKNVEAVDENIPQIKITTLYNEAVLESNGDIDLTNVETWNSIIFNTITTNGGKCLLAVSVDGGVTYKAYNIGLGAWQVVDITNFNDFAKKGMSKTITDSLTSTELELLRNGSKKVRFAYYLSVVDEKSIAESSDISINVAMSGYYVLANKNDYDVLIGEDNQSIEFKFYKSGTYTMKCA